MSIYIQIPNSITQLTKKSKHEEALVYAIIRSQIKDNSYKASISERQIAEIINMTERTVSSYVSDLKDSGLLKVAERKQGESGHPYNVYQFDELKKDYFMILPPLLCDNTISPKLKGLLLFIKANSWKGTNYLLYNGITTDLSEVLGVGKNQIKGYLEELQSKGYIRFIGKSIHIINANFPLSLKEDLENVTYTIIYNYCLEHDRVPPIKNVDKYGRDKALNLIVWEYQNENDRRDKRQPQNEFEYGRLRNALKERCKNLPEQLSLQYFCQVLVNKKPTREELTYTPLILQ